MEGEHLLHERPAVVEEGHLEPLEVVGHIAGPLLLQDWATSEVMGTTSVGKGSALRPRLEADGGADARETGEARLVGEVVLAAKAADGDALVVLPCERLMLADRRRQLLPREARARRHARPATSTATNGVAT